MESTADPTRARARRRQALFALVVVGAVGLGLVYAASAAGRGRDRAPRPSDAPPLAAAPLAAMLREPALLFRDAGFGASYGRMAAVSLADPGGARSLAHLPCERVHGGADTVICLQAHRGVITSYSALLLDRTLEQRGTVALPGIPSRTRVAQDGGVAATTVFVSGHSYAAGAFSTRASLLDVADGRELGELESFEAWHDGQRVDDPERNLWGITFAPGGRTFYATLSTGGEVYLVRGGVDTRRLEVLRAGVECPSLSPDGKRVAFKQRVRPPDAAAGTPPVWRFSVLDLASGTVTPLAEERSIDDQLEWLDPEHVLYGVPDEERLVSDVWVARADGTGTPRILVSEAESPAVLR
jgi:hypothetical protein